MITILKRSKPYKAKHTSGYHPSKTNSFKNHFIWLRFAVGLKNLLTGNLKMAEHNIYTIPYQDKFIIYQPLNKFAFLGNRAMVKLIAGFLNKGTVDDKKYHEVLAFLNSHGFFNKYNEDVSPCTAKDYKPTVAVLCMTSACNFRCSYCFASGGETTFAELPSETGKRAIDIVYNNSKALNAARFVVSFHGGGEPALPFKQLQDFTAYARRKDLPSSIELTSNGYWDDEKTAWIIANLDHLTLSFDGIKEVQNLQRPLANGKETVRCSDEEYQKAG